MNKMKPCIIPISSAQLSCEIYGEGKVTLVIEMGLGAVMAEWQHLAKRLSQRHTVLLYQRAGYGAKAAYRHWRVRRVILPRNCTSFCSRSPMRKNSRCLPIPREGSTPGHLQKHIPIWFAG